MRAYLALFILMSFAEVHAQTTIKIDGSSTVFPITEAMAEEFQAAQKGAVRVTVGISGTGGGFKKFCKGETDIQDASRPIQTKELADCKAAGVKFIELPIAYDATVVAVHKDNKLSEITTDDLKKMWAPESQGKVTTWKQVNVAWPDQPLKLYGAGSDSGTFDYFTEAIVGKAKSSRGDYNASEDDNTLVNGISGDKNALGYLPMAYFEMNKGKLKALAVKSSKSGKGVLPSTASVEDGTYTPLSRPIFIYVNEASMKKTPAVKEFTEYYLKNAASIVPQVKYVALPAAAYKIALEHVSKNKLGTVFGGHSDVGLRLEELLKKEGKM